ncbi:hypothetical protein HDV02_003841 [Globomyces sp. JEL0801]|nr:hypothetical protein HDV02_003841 [Globomyces sp. JEL0801]
MHSPSYSLRSRASNVTHKNLPQLTNIRSTLLDSPRIHRIDRTPPRNSLVSPTFLSRFTNLKTCNSTPRKSKSTLVTPSAPTRVSSSTTPIPHPTSPTPTKKTPKYNQSFLSPSVRSSHSETKSTKPWNILSSMLQKAPSTAPSKNSFWSPCRQSRVVEMEEFDVWEDPNIDNINQSSTTAIGLISPAGNKENSLLESHSRDNDPRHESTNPLAPIPISNFPAYVGIQQEKIQIIISPLPSKKNFRIPSSLPPPGKETRTKGSAFYRATSINMFKPKNLFMDTLSPSTPARIPERIKDSKLSQKLFLPMAFNHTQETSNPTDSRLLLVNQTEDNYEESIVKPTSMPRKVKTCPTPRTMYLLRPRPTPKPSAFSPNQLSSKKSGMIKSENVEPVYKKRRSLEKAI